MSLEDLLLEKIDRERKKTTQSSLERFAESKSTRNKPITSLTQSFRLFEINRKKKIKRLNKKYKIESSCVRCKYPLSECICIKDHALLLTVSKHNKIPARPEYKHYIEDFIDMMEK